jgi:uncharacterized protein (DUF1697 family)
MSSVVFLRAVNVGRVNRCRPAQVAKQLKRLDVVNIGAVGTFVVRAEVPAPVLRAAIARQLPFTCEIMICSAADLLKLAASRPFLGQPAGPDLTYFVNVLHAPLESHRHIPLALPTKHEWLLKVVTIRGRFIAGIYRRQMKAISCLGKFEKLVGVPATTRSWNTIESVLAVLKDDAGLRPSRRSAN